MTENPFFTNWDTPFGMPPFDRIRPEHFPPAFDRGMDEQIAEIAAIVAAPAPPSFADTIETMERSGRLLDRVRRVFSNLDSSDTNPALEAIARDYAPKLAQHQTRIALDAGLFARIADLYARRGQLGLAADQLRLLERHHLRFVRAGALLGPDEKARMAAISERLATLHTLFGQNVLHDEHEWRLVLDEADLDGLPGFARAAAAQAAASAGFDGRYVVTLARSSVEPFLTFSSRRDLRRAAYEAWTARGTHPGDADNTPLIREIMTLRAEQARLLGYDNFAAYRLDDTMAKTTDAVEHLLLEVWEPAKRKARAERARARRRGSRRRAQRADRTVGLALLRREGASRPIRSRRGRGEALLRARQHGRGGVRHGRASVRPELCRARRSAGLSPRRARLGGARPGRQVGLFLHDNFARPGKHSGAWTSRYRDQENLDGQVLPIVVNNNNFSKRGRAHLVELRRRRDPVPRIRPRPARLLSRVRYPSQSGTAVRRDFVEFPSQVFEHWMSVPENLRQYARHYRTGEPIPEALLERLLAARNFNQGFATVEYTASALIDLELHRDPHPESLDPDRFEREFLSKYGVPREIGLRHRPAHFQHLFAGGGYAAGYYAYLWAEVLDADGFAAFTEAGDAFDPALAARLKDIYSAGDTRDPMELYRAFRGRDPEIAALLRQRGLTEA